MLLRGKLPHFPSPFELCAVANHMEVWNCGAFCFQASPGQMSGYAFDTNSLPAACKITPILCCRSVVCASIVPSAFLVSRQLPQGVSTSLLNCSWMKTPFIIMCGFMCRVKKVLEWAGLTIWQRFLGWPNPLWCQQWEIQKALISA